MALSKRDMAERLNFVRFWADYIKTHTNKVWSRQQAMLIDSVIKTANKDPKLYMKVKRATAGNSALQLKAIVEKKVKASKARFSVASVREDRYAAH